MDDKKLVSPLLVQLVGGLLDGDTFELVPHGSVLPPMRLSYPYSDNFKMKSGIVETHGCWLHYECKLKVPEWTNSAIIYNFVGKEIMAEG